MQPEPEHRPRKWVGVWLMVVLGLCAGVPAGRFMSALLARGNMSHDLWEHSQKHRAALEALAKRHDEERTALLQKSEADTQKLRDDYARESEQLRAELNRKSPTPP